MRRPCAGAFLWPLALSGRGRICDDEEPSSGGSFFSSIEWSRLCGKEAYWLVMGRTRPFVLRCLKLINEDLKEHGEIRYEDHEMFAAIKWQPLSDVLGEKFADTL